MYGMCGRGCALVNPCAGVEICQNGGQCVESCDEISDYICNCSLGWTGKNCTDPVSNQVSEQSIFPSFFARAIHASPQTDHILPH